MPRLFFTIDRCWKRNAAAISANAAQKMVLTLLRFTRLPLFFGRAAGLALFPGEAPDEQWQDRFEHHFVVARQQIRVVVAMSREEGDGFKQKSRGSSGIDDWLEIATLDAAAK